MAGRREFLTRIVGAVSTLALPGSHVDAAESAPKRGSEPQRVLILGGTGHIGPYFVRAALARGHHVAVFSRGRSSAEIPAQVERLIGDRDGDLKSIESRDWDAVLDLATFGPGWVRTLGQRLSGRVGHYTFISTISVYENPAANFVTTETSPVLAYHGSADPYSVTTEGLDYGALKVLCEREAEKQFPGRTLIVRPDSIAGPDDTHPYILYWLLRMQRGGEVLAVGERSIPVQFIDVRDLAEWTIRMVDRRGTGIYNAAGPVPPADIAGLIDAARAAAAVPAKVTWVTRSWLLTQHDSNLFNGLVFWEQNKGYLTEISNARALAEGLTTRPIRVTMADELRWLQQQPAQTTVFTGFRPKQGGTGFEAVMVPWSVYLASEKALLRAWHTRGASRS